MAESFGLVWSGPVRFVPACFFFLLLFSFVISYLFSFVISYLFSRLDTRPEACPLRLRDLFSMDQARDSRPAPLLVR